MEKIPKSINEQLDELELDRYIVIPEDKRQSWASKISKHYKGSGKRFKIRQSTYQVPGEGLSNLVTELRVWRTL